MAYLVSYLVNKKSEMPQNPKSVRIHWIFLQNHKPHKIIFWNNIKDPTM